MRQAQSRRTLKVSGQEVSVPAISTTSLQEVSHIKDWRVILAIFISGQDVKDSSRTLYTRTLTQYFLWIEKTGRSLDHLTREDILEYKDDLLSSGLSALTISSYLVIVRKFYEWAESMKYYPNIAKGIKTPRRKQAFKKQHLPESKCTELLQYFKEMSLRDFAIVNLILRTGLRTIEVVRADVGDITFKGDRRVLLIWGKGHTEKDSFVVLSDKAYLPIKEYLESRKGVKAGDPLFISNSRQNNGERLTTRTISKICKDGLKGVGMDGREFTAHSLRHTTAVQILKQGGEITDVQRVLRHTSPVTSQIYTESIEEELRLQKSPEFLLDSAF
jgi:integrase/recombinase XerC/integrase/recombinase XerD